MLSFTKLLYKAGCHVYSVYMNTYGYRLHLCSWSHYYMINIHHCRCAWTHILFLSSRAWSHLRCKPMELLPASQYVFINGVRAWNNGRHQQHPIPITTVTLRDYLHWIIKSLLFVGWWYTWTYTSLFIIIIHLLQNTVICVPEVTLCMDTYCLDIIVEQDVMKTLHVFSRIS